MAQPLQLTYGRVKYTPGEPRQTTHGLRINAVITLPSGEEVKLWGDPGDPALTALKKGQQLPLAQNAKGGWQLVQQQEAQQAPVAPNSGYNTSETWERWTDDEKRTLAAKVEAHADLLAFCMKTAREKFAPYCETSEDIRCLATTLYLQALKK